MRRSRSREAADGPAATGDAAGVLYRTVQATTTVAGALAVVLAASYASVAVPERPSLYLAVWSVGLLALAAVPTAGTAAADAVVRTVLRSRSAGAAPSRGAPPRGTERGSPPRGCPEARSQRGAGDGCPCTDAHPRRARSE